MIGSRTGRLRLYDVPDFVNVEVYLDGGETHALDLSGSLLTETPEMISALSVIMEAGRGRFEFHVQPARHKSHKNMLPIGELAMMLVLHMDKKLAKRQALQASENFYILETPEPRITMDPDLAIFFKKSRHYVEGGVWLDVLAEYLNLEHDIVRLNMAYLHQLGFVKLLSGPEIEAIQGKKNGREMTELSNRFQLAVEMSDTIRRSTQPLIDLRKKS